MSRPTIALACIAKNERHNFQALFESIRGCFDEVHITDTGSTDGSLEYLTDLVKSGQDREVLGCPLYLHFFEWVNDFSAARNASFAPVKTDFVMWLDLDDSLADKENFILWCDTAMGLADYWLASYQYAFDDNGHPVCSFARERVFRVSKKPTWQYFVHEGVKPTKDMTPQYAITWRVKHRRTVDDMAKDKGRNLALFEVNKDKLDSRMVFYYGKELFEAGKPLDAYPHLMEAITRKDLEIHDRILGIQYAAFSSLQCNQYERAIEIAFQGIRLDPNRAEFHSLIGDSYIKLNRMKDAIPFYYAAKNCINSAPSGARFQGAIYNHEIAYGAYPTETLAKIFFTQASFERAKAEASYGVERFNSEPCRHILAEIDKANKLVKPDKTNLIETDEIVITSGPDGAYPWDSEIYKTKGLGGSETAAVEMSTWLAKKTRHKVIVFNPRKERFTDASGVEYRPVNEVLDYFTKYKPRTHIMWRHNTKLTDAPTYLWCHDLMAPGAENALNADKLICLSEFHKNYVRSMQGVAEDKIVLSRNGIDPKRFEGLRVKNKNKVIFPSSPDRGLDRAMLIMDEARKSLPDLELHVYYGLENLEKYGLAEMAKTLRAMMAERPWVKYHGNVDQKTLAKEMGEAVVWLYPANFIESFCITVLESVASGCYPLVRKIGALQNTVKPFADMGMAEIVDLNAETPEQREEWAKLLVSAVKGAKWQNIELSERLLEAMSWESVADEWIEMMEFSEKLRSVDLNRDSYDEHMDCCAHV